MIEAQQNLRAKLNEVILGAQQGRVDGLSHIEIAEVLVTMAVSFCDFNGGEADQEHARNVCHRLVDEAYDQQIPLETAMRL